MREEVCACVCLWYVLTYLYCAVGPRALGSASGPFRTLPDTLLSTYEINPGDISPHPCKYITCFAQSHLHTFEKCENVSDTRHERGNLRICPRDSPSTLSSGTSRREPREGLSVASTNPRWASGYPLQLLNTACHKSSLQHRPWSLQSGRPPNPKRRQLVGCTGDGRSVGESPGEPPGESPGESHENPMRISHENLP